MLVADWFIALWRSSVANVSLPKRHAPFVPSAAAVRHRETAVRSIEKMELKLALGHEDDKVGHGGKDTTIHKREDARRAKAIDVGLMILKEVGVASPRYKEIFPCDMLTSDKGMLSAFENIILNGIEAQAVIHHGAEAWRLFEWLGTLNMDLVDASQLRLVSYINNCSGRGRTVPSRVRNAIIWLQHVTGLL